MKETNQSQKQSKQEQVEIQDLIGEYQIKNQNLKSIYIDEYWQYMKIDRQQNHKEKRQIGMKNSKKIQKLLKNLKQNKISFHGLMDSEKQSLTFEYSFIQSPNFNKLNVELFGFLKNYNETKNQDNQQFQQKRQNISKGKQQCKKSIPQQKNTKIESNDFQILKIQTLGSNQVLSITVSVRYFVVQILVFQSTNTENFMQDHTQKFISGTNSNVYFMKDLFTSSKFVVKSIPINQKNFNVIFTQCLKEFALTKILSILNVGPLVIDFVGFDIVVHKNSLHFFIEKCQNYHIKDSSIPQLIDSNFFQRIEDDMKQNLRVMHFFKIIHLDIKPNNIAFSQKRKKWVFIDFGLTQVISQNIGQNCLVNFKGTFEYVCNQMRESFFEKKWVDIYYNDVYALQKTVKNIKSQLKIEKHSGCEYSNIFESQSIDFQEFAETTNKFNQTQHSLYPYQTQNLSCFYLITKQYSKFYSLWKHQKDWYRSNNFRSYNLTQSLQVQEFQWFSKSRYFSCVISFIIGMESNQLIEEVYFQFLNKQINVQKVHQLFEKRIKQKSHFFSSVQYTKQNYQQDFTHQQRHPQLLLIFFQSFHKNQIKNFISNRNKNQILRILYNPYAITQFQLNKEGYAEIYFQFNTFRNNLFNVTLDQKLHTAQIFIKQFFDGQIDGLSFRKQFYTISSQKNHNLSQKTEIFVQCCQKLLIYCGTGPPTRFKKEYFIQIIQQYLFFNSSFFTPSSKEESVQISLKKIQYFFREIIKVAKNISQNNDIQFYIYLFRIERAIRILQFQYQHCVTLSKLQIYQHYETEIFSIQSTNKNLSKVKKLMEDVTFFTDKMITQNKMTFLQCYFEFQKIKSKIQRFPGQVLPMKDKNYLKQSLTLQFLNALDFFGKDNSPQKKQLICSQFSVQYSIEMFLQPKIFMKDKPIDENALMYVKILSNQMKIARLTEVLKIFKQKINNEKFQHDFLTFQHCYALIITGQYQDSIELVKSIIQHFNPFNYKNQSYLCNLILNISELKIKLQSYQYSHFYEDEKRYKNTFKNLKLAQNFLILKIVIFLLNCVKRIRMLEQNKKGLSSKDPQCEISEEIDNEIDFMKFQILVLKQSFIRVMKSYNFDVFYNSFEHICSVVNSYITKEQFQLYQDKLNQQQKIIKSMLQQINLQKSEQPFNANEFVLEVLFEQYLKRYIQQVQVIPKYIRLKQSYALSFKRMQYKYYLHFDPQKVLFDRFDEFRTAFLYLQGYYLKFLHDFLKVFSYRCFISHLDGVSSILSDFSKISSQYIYERYRTIEFHQLDYLVFCFIFKGYSQILKNLQPKIFKETKTIETQKQTESQNRTQYVNKKLLMFQIQCNRQGCFPLTRIETYKSYCRQTILQFCSYLQCIGYVVTMFMRFKPAIVSHIMLYLYNFNLQNDRKTFFQIFATKVLKYEEKQISYRLTQSSLKFLIKSWKNFFSIVFYHNKRLKQQNTKKQIKQKNDFSNQLLSKKKESLIDRKQKNQKNCEGEFPFLSQLQSQQQTLQLMNAKQFFQSFYQYFSSDLSQLFIPKNKNKLILILYMLQFILKDKYLLEQIYGPSPKDQSQIKTKGNLTIFEQGQIYKQIFNCPHGQFIEKLLNKIILLIKIIQKKNGYRNDFSKPFKSSIKITFYICLIQFNIHQQKTNRSSQNQKLYHNSQNIRQLFDRKGKFVIKQLSMRKVLDIINLFQVNNKVQSTKLTKNYINKRQIYYSVRFKIEFQNG